MKVAGIDVAGENNFAFLATGWEILMPLMKSHKLVQISIHYNIYSQSTKNRQKIF